MSYIFPRRNLRKTDVLDPEDMNEDFVPAADLAGGGLNEHNISQTVKDQLLTADGAYHTPHVVMRRSNPGLPDANLSFTHAVPNAYSSGREGDSGGWWIPDDYQWHRIDAGGVNEMKVTATQGTGKLWIIGWLQYFWLPDHNLIGRDATLDAAWWEDNATRIAMNKPVNERLAGGVFTGNYAANVRFGIRVDGRLIEATVTGTTSKKPRPGPYTPKYPTAAERGCERPVGETHSQNPAASAIRVGCIVDVGPGEHTVELVARRVKYVRKANKASGLKDEGTGKRTDDFIVVYNSQLFAMEIPEAPSVPSPGKEIVVDTFKAEDSFDNTEMYAHRMKDVRDGYNDLRSDSLSRGSLNHNHLKSPVLWAGTVNYSGSGIATHSNSYPNYEWPADPMPDYGTGPGPGGYIHDFWPTCLASADNHGWHSLRELAVGDPTTGLDVHTEKCFLVVMGNVQVYGIFHGNGTIAAPNDNDVLATFALGYTTCGTDGTVYPARHAPDPSAGFEGYDTWFAIHESICHFNNTNMNRRYAPSGIDGHQIGENYTHVDVPLFWVADMTKRTRIGAGGTSLNGTYHAQPPLSAAGDQRNYKSFHILSSLTPRGGDKGHMVVGGAEVPPGTHDATYSVGRCNLSAFLLRY